MILSSFSKSEIIGITEILNKYEILYEVRDSATQANPNFTLTRSAYATKDIEPDSKDLKEIEFSFDDLNEVISDEDREVLNQLRVVLDQDSVLSKEQLDSMIEANPAPRKKRIQDVWMNPESKVGQYMGRVLLLIGLGMAIYEMRRWF